jgi:hypothetical protein
MKKVKSITITTCVVLSSIVMFSASALAAPAIVNSDSSLKFDDVKLQQVLTQISDKEPSLNIVFYSTNTLSPNTVILPNGSKVNKAVYANDNFIGSIKRPNYISLYYNKDDSNPNKGSFSANVGSDFRTLITTQDISNGIVKPNIGKYLPQDPESFIPVVAEQVVVQIKAKQQQIEADIENKRLQVIRDANNKQAWDNGISFIVTMVVRILFILIILYLVNAVVKRFKSNSDEYKKYKELLEQVNISYSKLVEQSTYLNGYTGATGEKANYFLECINRINEEYLALKALPKFINVIFETSKWATYTSNLYNLNSDLTVYLENIDAFLKSIEGLSGTDPLAEIIKQQELKKKQDKLNSLVNIFNKQYQDGSAFLDHSNIHSFKAQAITSLNSNDDINTKIDSYQIACDVINKEVILINRLSKLKHAVKDIANYIISNNNTYYSNLNPITKETKDWAKQLLDLSTNHINYFDLKPVEDIKQDLDFFALEYKQQDAQYRVTNDRKASLINKVNINFPTKFILIRDRLLKEIREVIINSDFNLAQQTLDRLEREVNTLIKDANAYKSRQNKLSNYSGTRKAELTKQLGNNNYSNFDVLIVNYNDEDERTKRASYSSSSYLSYNSNPSSYSDSSSYSSSSSSSSWSSSSSDDSSWSSSSSDDSSSTSSSSDDSW